MNIALNFSLVINILILILLFLGLVLLVELVRIACSFRKIIGRVELASDLKGWWQFFSGFKKKA
jgi:hypothetical protein